MEEHRCSECGKVFSSEEMLERHSEMEHGHRPVEEKQRVDITIPVPDRRSSVGFVLGFILAIALIGGYTYFDSVEPTVGVTIVTCDNCSYSEFRDTTGEIFKVDYKEVDYRSEKGQQLVKKYDLNYVPGFIFDKDVSRAENFTMVRSVLVEFDGAYVLPDKGVRAAQRVSQGKTLE